MAAPRITLIDNPMHDLEVLRELTPSGLNVTIVERRGDNFAEVLRNTDYLVGYADKEMDDAFYENARSLKVIQLISAGYDKVNIQAARRAGVAVCNNGVVVQLLHRITMKFAGGSDGLAAH